MLRCSRCETWKDESCFSKSTKTTRGYQSRCKACSANQSPLRSDEEKARYGVSVKAKKAEVKDFIREAKNVPCHDCGQRYHYCVMDFDHRPGEVKSFNFGHHPFSIRLLKIEMAKCDVVCSNCHRLRTFNRL